MCIGLIIREWDKIVYISKGTLSRKERYLILNSVYVLALLMLVMTLWFPVCLVIGASARWNLGLGTYLGTSHLLHVLVQQQYSCSSEHDDATPA